MKLNPPDSSSDLEIAREIARRLHQHRRRDDRAAGAPEPAPALAKAAPPRPPVRMAPPPARPEPEPSPLPVADLGPGLASAEGRPAPPAWEPPGPTLEDDPLAGFGGPGPEPEEPALPPAEDEGEAVSEAPDSGFEPGEPDILVEDSPGLPGEEPVSPEEMVGAPEPAPLDDLPAPGDAPSPFDVELDDTGDEPTGALRSWDDVVEACLALGHARGAMLVDPAGQVFAFRGEWPPPGPEAIAAKLVATMERTLKDAPTRSISAPLMGQHLTAWRVPLAEGLVTAAFIGDAPVRAETRPAIDSEIHHGAGA